MNGEARLGAELFRWVLQTTWQAAVLAVLILGAQWLLRRQLSAGRRYGLWLLLVARLLMPLAPPSPLSVFNLIPADPPPRFAVQSPSTPRIKAALASTSALPAQPAAQQPQVEPLRDGGPPPSGVVTRYSPPKIHWFKMAFWTWLAGFFFFAARLVWTNARFHARLAACQPVMDAQCQRLLDDCREGLKVGQTLCILETDEVEAPGVYGVWQTWLLLPNGLLDRFSERELRCVFLHELAHIKRGDLKLNWLVSVLQAVHWFNPILWLAWRRMKADRELAADALALAHANTSDRLSYGETILKVLAGLSGERPLPGVVGIGESKSQLKERLTAISRPAKGWKWAALAALALLTAVGLTRSQTKDSGLNQGTVGNPASFARQYGRITGIISNYGSPVVGQRFGLAVLSNRRQPEILQQAATDAKGQFAFNQVPAGTWVLFQMRPGKAMNIGPSLLDPIGVHPNESIRIEISQEPFSSPSVSSDWHGNLFGTILDPSGRPASKAQVMILRQGSSIALSGKPVLFNPQFGHPISEERCFCTTDDHGQFALNDIGTAWALAAADETGFIVVPLTNLTVVPSGSIANSASFAINRIKLERWGRIEGTLWTTNEAVHAKALYYDLRNWVQSSAFDVKSDELGHFSIGFVPPGQFALFAAGMREAVVVKPGQTSVANLGGNGRLVVGKFRATNKDVEIDWTHHYMNFAYLSPIPSYFPPDLRGRFKDREEYLAWRLQQSELRPLRLEVESRGRNVKVEKDGSFRIEQVPPGTYELGAMISYPDDAKPKLRGYFDAYDRVFNIPASKSGSPEPLDLGNVEITLTPPVPD